MGWLDSLDRCHILTTSVGCWSRYPRMGVPLSASGEDMVVVRFMFGWLSCEAGFAHHHVDFAPHPLPTQWRSELAFSFAEFGCGFLLLALTVSTVRY
jgi:hypothetical protein